MNSNEFVSLLSDRTGREEKETKRMISYVSDIITEGLQDGKTVTLRGLGVFEVRKKLEKIIVNPSTGKRTLFPPRLIIGFRSSFQLKGKNNLSEEK